MTEVWNGLGYPFRFRETTWYRLQINSQENYFFQKTKLPVIFLLPFAHLFLEETIECIGLKDRFTPLPRPTVHLTLTSMKMGVFLAST